MTHERAAEAEALPRFNEHTELPWSIEFPGTEDSPQVCIGGGDQLILQTVGGNDAMNAAFATHACNTYYTRLSSLSAKEQEVRELVEALREVKKKTDHGIPYYGYGDSEGGVYLAGYLSDIEKLCETILSKHPQP